MFWDSGPLPVDQQGTFSVLIPKEGQAAVAIYPREFAPQFVMVGGESNGSGANSRGRRNLIDRSRRR